MCIVEGGGGRDAVYWVYMYGEEFGGGGAMRTHSIHIGWSQIHRSH